MVFEGTKIQLVNDHAPNGKESFHAKIKVSNYANFGTDHETEDNKWVSL